MINDELQKIVDEQAEDEALWAVPYDRPQPIAEACLQQALRRLHIAICNRNYDKDTAMKSVHN